MAQRRGRGRPRQTEHDTSQALSRAALRRFAAQGYEATSLREIAADRPALASKFLVFDATRRASADDVLADVQFEHLLVLPGGRDAHATTATGFAPYIVRTPASAAHAAAALFEENVQAYKAMGEPDNEHRLMNMTQLARVYNEKDLARHDDSIRVLREALERYRRTLGEANSNTDACLELVDRHAEGLERVSQGDPFYSDDEEEDEEEDDEDDEDEDDE